MKIGIVGGTGNISQPIVRLLLEKGHEVVLFNRGKGTKSPDGVRVIQGDRNNHVDFEQKMQAEKFDAAIDMICFTAEDASSSVRAFRGVGWFVQTTTSPLKRHTHYAPTPNMDSTRSRQIMFISKRIIAKNFRW
jgi:nucleoside-diphosphate-sugar epimerase